MHRGLIPKYITAFRVYVKLKLRVSIDPIFGERDQELREREAKVKGCRREIKEVYRLLPICNTTIAEYKDFASGKFCFHSSGSYP